MTDEKVYADKHVTYWWVSNAGIANPLAPTPAEINAGVNLSQAIAWEGTEINPDSSSDIDDAAITDSATAVEPGFDQFGGTLNMFYPKDMTNLTDPYVVAYNIFAPGRILGYLVRRFTPAAVNTNTSAATAAAGEWVEVFKVQADYTSHDTEGEDSTKFTVNFLPQGFMSGLVKIATATAVVTAPATLPLAASAKSALTASLSSDPITFDVTWATSNAAVATVSNTGVVKGISAGTANITATYASATGAGTTAVTVS